MDDLYVYLRARANDAVGRVRPAKHEDKPDGLHRGGKFLHGQAMTIACEIGMTDMS